MKQQRLVVAGEGNEGGGGGGLESPIFTDFITVYFYQTEVSYYESGND